MGLESPNGLFYPVAFLGMRQDVMQQQLTRAVVRQFCIE